MTEDKLVILRINVLPGDDSAEQDQLNDFSRQLYQDLKDSKADEVKLAFPGDSPKGAKGFEGLAAEITVSFVAHYAPKVIDLIRQKMNHNPKRSVKLTSNVSGQEVAVTISSNDLKSEDVDKIVQSLLASFG